MLTMPYAYVPCVHSGKRKSARLHARRRSRRRGPTRRISTASFFPSRLRLCHRLDSRCIRRRARLAGLLSPAAQKVRWRLQQGELRSRGLLSPRPAAWSCNLLCPLQTRRTSNPRPRAGQALDPATCSRRFRPRLSHTGTRTPRTPPATVPRSATTLPRRRAHTQRAHTRVSLFTVRITRRSLPPRSTSGNAHSDRTRPSPAPLRCRTRLRFPRARPRRRLSRPPPQSPLGRLYNVPRASR